LGSADVATPDSAETAAQRIDELLAELRSGPTPRVAEVAEELTRCLVQLYGAGLTKIAAMLGPERVTELCADPLVESLLLVHDLHPVDPDTRIRSALQRAGPATGDVEHLGIDEAGIAHVRLSAAGRGCGSSRQAVVADIEAVVRQAAPEAVDVVVEIPAAPPPLLQVSMRPGIGRPDEPLVAAET
jgi:Fe-S cluster biogenesis protein NfuA